MKTRQMNKTTNQNMTQENHMAGSHDRVGKPMTGTWNMAKYQNKTHENLNHNKTQTSRYISTFNNQFIQEQTMQDACFKSPLLLK